MAEELITIGKMAKELSRKPNTIKKQLRAKGIKPTEYYGPTGMYQKSALEEIRTVPHVGRPKKAGTVLPNRATDN
jgi:hypothetical protein